MKRKVIYFSICMLFILSNMATVQGNAASIALGRPGLSYRFVQTFGETQVPYFADANHLNSPVGLFMDGSNHLFVVEEWGHRVLKYDSTPSIESIWGKAGDGAWVVFGDNENLFFGPRDVALDNSGNVWVADANRIVQYGPDGVYLQQLPVDDPWAAGDDNTHFNDVNGIAIDAIGRMFVSDKNNHRVQVYDLTSGSPVYSATLGVAGEPGADNSHFNQPWRLALDSLDRLVVADSGNGRVQQCAYAGGWSCTTLDSGLNHPQGLTVDGNDTVYIADTDSHRIRKCPSGACIDFATGTPKFTDLAVDSSGNVYGTAPEDHNVVQYDSSGLLVGPYLGMQGVPYLTDAYHYNIPLVSSDAENNILITEEWGHRLVKLDPNGRFLWSFGVAGVAGGDEDHLSSPMMVATDSNGQIYVPDRWSCRVKIISPDGVYKDTLGTGCGSGEYEFNPPYGAAVDKDGNIYVADRDNQRVMIYDSALAYIGQIGETGVCSPDNDHLCNPNSVAFDPAGNVYVADSGNRRVQVFDSSLQWRMTIGNGIEGQQFDQFAWPQRVVVDGQGKIYVSDAWNNRIQVFDSSGAYLTTIGGSMGTNSAQFMTASSVAVDGEGNVYISDSGNSRINKYAPGVPGWKQANINGFGDPNSSGLFALEVFGGQLYAGAANWAGGGTIWRTSDGRNWSRASEPGFSATYIQGNNAILDMIEFNGNLYASTGWGGIGGQIWRSRNGTAWTQVVDNGFGDPENFAIAVFTTYNGMLYASTQAGTTHGTEIWRSRTGGNGSWTRVVSNGFDNNLANTIVTGYGAFNGYLYAITENTSEGTEIWRTKDGTKWTQANINGFGDRNNTLGRGLVVYKGNLYASTVNNFTGGQIWRTANGTTWRQVIGNGFGDPNNAGMLPYVFGNELYASTGSSSNGMEVWRTSNGNKWIQVNPDGFGDSNNIWDWVNAHATFQGRHYIGTFNTANGGEVWQMLSQTYHMSTTTDQALLPSITR
jgi:hypothetical protein